jgi:hypothetical protein
MALEERNRLSHHFYRQHNFRKNSNKGREIMLKDLDSIHETLMEAYKAIMLLSGIDLDALVKEQQERNRDRESTDTGTEDESPVFHLPI